MIISWNFRNFDEVCQIADLGGGILMIKTYAIIKEVMDIAQLVIEPSARNFQGRM